MGLSTRIIECKKCPAFRNCVVSPVPPTIGGRIMVVTSHPDTEDGLTVQLFVGRGGDYLRTMLGKAGIKEEDVTYTSIIKCTTPQNREPLNVEISSCIKYLFEEIDDLKPSVIFTLGKFPTRILLNLPKVFKLKDLLGGQCSLSIKSDNYLLIPNHCPYVLLNRGKKEFEEAISIFRKGIENKQ